MSVEVETNGGSVTSWAPLTTVFTPPPGCESTFRMIGDPSTGRLMAFDPGYGLDVDKSKSVNCEPSAVTAWWEQGRMGANPGTRTSIQPLTCPYLWTTVATKVRDITTTQIMCCPPGYTNPRLDQTDRELQGYCISGASKDMIFTFAAGWPSPPYSIVTTTLSESSDVEAIPVFGYNVARATPIATASPDLSSRLSSSSPSAPSSSPTDNELSTGEKAGIGLGVSFGVLGICALSLMVFLHRRRKKDTSSKPAPVEISGAECTTSGPTQEIDGRPVYSEMPSGEVHSPVELDT